MTEKEVVEKLEQWGVDPEIALEGMQGDMAFYCSMLQKMAEDQDLLNLENVILDGDPKEAFMKVHSLRGGAGSLGLTPLTDILAQLTEQLREYRKEEPDDRKRLEELTKMYVQVRREFLECADRICGIS